MMLPIAVDAMGGDQAPGAIIAGARAAAAEGTPILLVGPADLKDRVDIGDLALFEAGEVIEMDEDGGRAVRRKKDSTLVRAAEAVRDRQASAMISAGNTGATMASALLRMGRIRGVSRPAIAEVQPDWLVQFAQMGSVFSRHRFGIAAPKVGLLSIGEEPGKGDALRKEAFELLTAAAAATDDLRFIGNVEGRDVMSDTADVIVTDGFTGNVVLKTLEGGLKALVNALLLAFASTPEYQHHADALMPAMLPLYTAFDAETYGGAMLLGVDGVCVIAHGSSTDRAILNGINVAREMVEADVVGEISRAIAAGASAGM